jgi:hypothetical protein
MPWLVEIDERDADPSKVGTRPLFGSSGPQTLGVNWWTQGPADQNPHRGFADRAYARRHAEIQRRIFPHARVRVFDQAAKAYLPD